MSDISNHYGGFIVFPLALSIRLSTRCCPLCPLCRSCSVSARIRFADIFPFPTRFDILPSFPSLLAVPFVFEWMVVSLAWCRSGLSYVSVCSVVDRNDGMAVGNMGYGIRAISRCFRWLRVRIDSAHRMWTWCWLLRGVFPTICCIRVFCRTPNGVF